MSTRRKGWTPKERVVGGLAALVAWLPRGRALAEPIFRKRHRNIVIFALIQAVGIGLYGLIMGFSLAYSIAATIVIAIPAVLALYRGAGRRLAVISATCSLMFASATFVDLSHGLTEAHFHFFVMVGIVALYQDWTAFGVCILITFFHHAVIGSLYPKEVFGSSFEWHDPILWAGIHGLAILALCVTQLIAWKTYETRDLSDPLTQLANRTAFLEYLERELAQPDNSVSVMFVDVDNFKAINDAVGHSGGDQALIGLGRLMGASMRSGDMISRFGGDEFGICVHGDHTQASVLAARILGSLATPMVLEGRAMTLSVSIGIVDDRLGETRDAGELLRDADLAMYLAKSDGKGRVVTYTKEVDKTVRDRAELVEDIGNALLREELEVYYQPLVDGTSERLVGVEALLRWHHRTRGLVPPGEFIALAEQTGAIVDIGRWVLRDASAQVVAWQREIPELSELRLAVNLSPVQLRDPNLLSVVGEVLSDTGLRPTSLTLEVTEGVLLADLEFARRQLEALRALGLRIAIDDFGTGYSSLSYLSQLPVDTVKIDRSFVRELNRKSGHVVMVRAIIDMATGLGLTVVAEGVEQLPQQETLNQLGSMYSQGYLYSPPVDALTFGDLARGWNTRDVLGRGGSAVPLGADGVRAH